MSEIDPLVLKLIADTKASQAELRQFQRVTDQSLGNIERMGNRMSTSLSRSFKAAAGSAAVYLGALATLGTARELLRIADSAKTLEAQLRLATNETGSFAQAQNDVRRIATETRSSLEATAQLYATFQRNAVELGISQEQAARATETVSKAFTISGATAAEAAGGLRQFLQGLQSGTLRGEELNSVLENAPRLARLLADSLGVTVGQLRALGQEGNLAADKLINALTNKKFTDGIDAEFRELPVTFEQAMQQVENAATITFGAFDRGGGFSQMLANFITDGANGFADLEKAAEEAGINMRATFEGLGDVFDPMLEGARSAFSQIGIEAKGLRGEIGDVLGIIDDITGFVNTYSGWGALTGAYGTSLRSTFESGFDQSQRDRRGALAEQGLKDLFRNVDVYGNPVARTRVSSGGGNAKADAAAARKAAAAARKAEQERLAAIRDDASKAREVASLQDDILAARAAMATASSDILSFDLQQIDREKEAKLAQYQTDVRLGDLSEEEFAQRRAFVEEEANLRKQLADIRRRERDAALVALQQQNAARDQIDTLDAESRVAETRQERRAIEQRILDATYKQEEAAIRQSAARDETADLDEALRNLMRRRLADEELLRRQSLSPGQRYVDDLQSEAKNLGDAYEDVAVRGLERMNDALTDSVKKALGLHGVLGDIISDFIELAVRQAVLKPLANALFGDGEGGGGIGNLIRGIGSIFGGGKATGGPVSSGTTYLVGERGPELFRPTNSGQIIPNNALGAGVATVRLVLSGDIDARIDERSTAVSVEVVRQSAPAIIDTAKNATIKDIQRPRL